MKEDCRIRIDYTHYVCKLSIEEFTYFILLSILISDHFDLGTLKQKT